MLLTQNGLAPTELQLKVFDRADRFVGRTDFAWPELGVLGEFDGRVKYGRTLAVDGDPGQALWDEKLREDALRELGWVVVRWVWADLEHPGAWFARLERALSQAGRRPTPAGSWRRAARHA